MLSFHSLYYGLSLAVVIVGINALMLSFLLPFKLFLPTRIYWELIKYFYTQYHWKWVLYNWSKIKVTFEGQRASLPKGEAAIVISNHQDDLDFGTHILSYMEDDIRASETKWVAKNIFAFVPFIGWVHWLIGDLFLKQSWEKDGAHIREWLAQFKERHFKLIFPEGTPSKNKKKLSESQAFAKTNNLPVLDNVLYPRTKGFSLIAKYFRDHPGTIDHVYDYTFGYLPSSRVSLEQFVQGPIPVNIHIHVTRHRLADIGREEHDFAAWCVYRFQVKDKLLSYFSKHHHFPSTKELIEMEQAITQQQQDDDNDEDGDDE